VSVPVAQRYTVIDSITAFDPNEWNNCFPGEIENWNYYRAVEEGRISGFVYRYFAVIENNSLRAVIPAFLTTYRLDTTVQGPFKRVTSALARCFPKLLSIDLLCVGSPVSEICHAGFAPGTTDDEKRTLLAALVGKVKRYAQDQRIGLLAVKDAREEDSELWRPALTGFAKMAGLPTAILVLPFRSLDDYLKSLSAATRKGMRRKLRSESAIRVEPRTSIDDVKDRIQALYEATEARSDLQFERLPADYFSLVLARMPDNARCILYWVNDELLAFNLIFESPERMIDKFIGTGEQARRYNLYFLSWMENVRRCIAQGIPIYQSGQAGYAVKVRLGSRLALNWNYFLHLNPLLNTALRLVARIVRLDRFDPEIRHAIDKLK
jgi:predicted N-acyltransferase